MKLVYTMDNKINGLRWRDIMSLFIKRSMALLMAAILALNLVGINTFAEESDNEDTINATPFEIDDEFSVSEEEGKSTEDNITDKIEENDEPIDSDSDVIVDKLLITGFADLDVAFFSVEEKLPMEELGLPEQLPVYINDVDELVYIDVNWICNDDYENTEYEMYTFSPVWDDSFELDVNLDAFTVPFIEVEILYEENINQREGIVVTPEEGDYDISSGTIIGLKASYLATLTDEQKQNINLVIPESINRTTVTAIGDKAFSRWYNTKYEGFNFIGLDLSQASSLMIIGNDAFYNAKGITGDLIIPDTVTTIGNNAFRECTGLNGELKLSDSLVSIGQYAFNNCNFIGKLQLPPNLNTIGDSAFRMNTPTITFTGELVIPAGVTEIGVAAFSGQQGITSLSFEGNKIDKLPDSVFRYCIGLVGAVKIPDSIQRIGRDVFAETGLNTIYLPKIADSKKYVIEGHAFYDSKKLGAIVCSKEDYKTIYALLTEDGIGSKLGYEMTVKFVTDNDLSFTPITRLYKHAFNMEKNDNGEWIKTDYEFPKIQGKAWGLVSGGVSPVLKTDLVNYSNLYLIHAYEIPVITYSINIDKIYDGDPVTLSVSATHPLAKPYALSNEGDVVFMYTWDWGTIGPSPHALYGYDKNQYSFSDARAPYEIACVVKVQACIRKNGKIYQFYVEEYDFGVYIRQANPIVNPLCSSYTVNINGTLPEIKLSEGDTPGTITWDKGQTIKEGTHEYKWTYTPEKNSVGSYNYKTIKGSTKLFASNGDAYIVNTEDCENGSIVLDKPYGAIKGEDVTIRFKPNSGYKLSSASLDDTNIFDQVLDNKYTIRNIQSDHTVNAAFTSMDIEDVKEIIGNLPDIDNDITEEVKNDILDAKLHYDAVNGSTDGDIAEEAKEKMYEAISKLEQVETVITKNDNVTNKIEITDEVHLLENMETEDAEALKNNNNASLKIELVVENTEIDEEKDKVLDDILGDNIIGESFDVSVVKILKDNNDTTRKELTELKKPIQIVFEIPKDLPSIESGYVREFSIIRLHNVKGQIIPEVLKDEDPYEDYISVSSDKFSTYIIVYKDVKKENGSQGGGSGSYSKTYTVTFDALGGSHIAAIKDIKQGKKITQPASPSRKGYTFTGWFIDAKCTKPFDFTKDTIKADMTLYAGWKKVEETMTYNVIFNTLGGNYIPDQSIEEGQKVLMPTEPSKEGYAFTGWYSDKECSQLWDFNASTINADTVLYAGWQKTEENTNQTIISKPIEEENEVQNDENTNKVPFESEEGIYKIKLIDTVDPSIMWILEASEGQKLVLKDMPEKEGYVFKGYFTDEKCTKPWNEDETIQKDISLYAGWDKIEDNNNLNNDEQNTNKTEEEVPTKDADSTSIFIIILVIAVIIGGIVVILRKKKK